MLTHDFEKSIAAAHGWTTVCGVDEVGRGPLAGPVYVAAVLLGDAVIEDLNDSKQVKGKRRLRVYDEIIAKAAGYAVAFSTVEQIERTGILEATLDAMRRAVSELIDKHSIDGALIDGDVARGFPIPAVPVEKGDAKCPSIAAASIIAKVTRDRYMCEVAATYPQYSFSAHKGYGTKKHFAEIDEHGLCDLHRPSFLQKHFAKKKQPTKTKGSAGEKVALDYLRLHGWTECERNHHSRYGEIDLIVKNEQYLAFVEVKLRQSSGFGEARESVDAHKQSKLRKTAELWLADHPTTLQPRFDVIEIYLPNSSAEQEQIVHIKNAF